MLMLLQFVAIPFDWHEYHSWGGCQTREEGAKKAWLTFLGRREIFSIWQILWRKEMRKYFGLTIAVFTFCLCGSAWGANYDLPLVGEYVNDAGYLVIAPAADSQNANYDVGLNDNAGTCRLQIVCATWKNSETQTAISPATHPNAIVAVESQKYSKFSAWPEDETVRLSEDALSEAGPDCQKAFKNNLVFTRKK